MPISRRYVLAAATLGAAVSPSLAFAQTSSKAPQNLQTLIDRASSGNGHVNLEAGHYETDGLHITKPLTISGVRGQSIIHLKGNAPQIQIEGAHTISLQGLSFNGHHLAGDIIQVRDVPQLQISECQFQNSGLVALNLERCGGRVEANQFFNCGRSAIFALDSTGLDILHNTIRKVMNNGIQVWSSEPRYDGTLIHGNRVQDVRALDGGDGQNGNAISVFRAGSVIISHNHTSDCKFSGVRVNSGQNCQVIANSIERCDETALYVEFASVGAVVANNMIDDVATGITVTNFDVGGRLAVVSNNVVRNIRGRQHNGEGQGVGVYIEADSIATSNLIENAQFAGILLGWGNRCPNLTAQNNMVKNCLYGLVASITDGAGPHVLANNVIIDARAMAITTMDYQAIGTKDISALSPTELPKSLTLLNNIIR